MAKEYELKVLDIDYKSIIRILKNNGAKKVHKPIMFQRSVFHLADTSVHGFVRVRDEGNSTTITSKTYKDPKFPDENEVQITGTYEDGCKLVRSMGLKEKAFQQTYREKW